MREPSRRSIPTERDVALAPLVPGHVLRISHGELAVYVAPAAGGRLYQVAFDGRDWLSTYSAGHPGAISWGCFPMVPWAGRIRGGRFKFGDREYRVPMTLGAHAIHGTGYDLPWTVVAHAPDRVELGIELPCDDRWPFGGSARQVIVAGARRLVLTLAVRAGGQAMPAVVGWHPWFLKPDVLRFIPDGLYPRDAEGIAVPTLAVPTRGPWDDCFSNSQPVTLERGTHALRLESDCPYWVVYDEPGHATCIEPQSGPPNGFNTGLASILEPGAELASTFTWSWSQLPAPSAPSVNRHAASQRDDVEC